MEDSERETFAIFHPAYMSLKTPFADARHLLQIFSC